MAIGQANSINMKVAGNGGYIPVTTVGSGSPNGVVIGLVGDIYFDSVAGIGYTCTVAGTATTAVWQQEFTNASAINWVNAGGNTTMSNNTYYLNQGASASTFTLPTTAAVGSRIRVQGGISPGWTIVLNSGQKIQCGINTTTTTTGSVASTNQYDTIEITCIVANTTFSAALMTGNLNVT